ncbi:MAG: hypothetical protein LBS06_07440 [Treponema sp.]|jgi:hypothetical protein|nr:hypothetical protein [Treponema sp.]
MVLFSVTKEWIILAPAGVTAAGTAAAELSFYIAALRGRAGLGRSSPPIADTGGPAPPDSAPVIILDAGHFLPGDSGGRRSGFTWRAGQDRIEIYGDSDRGLCNGVFDFLSNLGIRWPAPGMEELPDCADRGEYQLKTDRAHAPSEDAPGNRRRIVIDKETAPKKRDALIRWAARNRVDALVFSLGDRVFRRPRNGNGSLALAERYAMIIEAGGWDLSLLVPRGYFFLHRDLFRMDSGKRIRRFNFCPSNPQTIALLKKEGKRRFGALLRLHPEVDTFHLWPDRGHETTWCSCPTCRAFSRSEQNRMALCAAADALTETSPSARLSFFEEAGGDSPESAAGTVLPRPNLFRLETLPRRGLTLHTHAGLSACGGPYRRPGETPSAPAAPGGA